MAKNYLAVDTSSPNYPLVEGTFFNKFDCYTEFVKAVEHIAPGILNYKILSERVGQKPRREVLIECSFKSPNYSSAQFYIYVCPLEGGGRFEDEQRIQFNPSNRWSPNLHSLEKAHKFLTSDDKTGLETYVLGIYKTSENDDNIVFSGLYPSSIETIETDNDKNSTSSVQVRIGSIQRAYQSGVDMENTSTGFPIINFTPDNLFWYMINRDNLHVGDLEQIAKLVKAHKTTPLSIPKIAELGSLQRIYFGAPGTGKSHTIKQACKIYEHYRITFHPDTDYASFVGSYKPTVKPVSLRDVTGKVIKENDTEVTEDKIIYSFVKQTFLKAYIAAWREQEKEVPKPVFLVIEEINRGNCAQIFGDIFQLLDRNEHGFSDYPIDTDSDLEMELKKELGSLKILNAESINTIYDNDIISKVLNGSYLLLPSNLYIWATMNTSDQSLFPIDSAFKRRWDWKYVKITDSGKGYRIAVNGNEYDWWKFIEAINTHIGSDTSQEDKKLGYFFAKATKDADNRYLISADTFLSKVIFFIYNDVYKDFGFDNIIFRDENGKTMYFADYFDHMGNTVQSKVERFLLNLELSPNHNEHQGEDMDNDIPVKTGLNARVNGIKVWTITYALYQVLRAVAQNLSYYDLQNILAQHIHRDIDIIKTIPSAAGYQKEPRWYNYKPLSTKDGKTFVITNQWKKEYIPQIKALANTLNVSYEDLNETTD